MPPPACQHQPAYSPATAADADAGDNSKLAELNDPIVVIGERGGYDAKDTRSATKTDTPLKDVPQAVSVITAQQIEDQSLRSIADVIYFVPGASSIQARATATPSARLCNVYARSSSGRAFGTSATRSDGVTRERGGRSA